MLRLLREKTVINTTAVAHAVTLPGKSRSRCDYHLDLQSGNTHSYISYLKDIVEEECDLSVRAGVLVERLKSYEPELPKDMEPMVYVNYCEKSELGNPRCQKLSDLDSKTVEQDKAWYADRDPNTNEPKTTAQMFFTVYYEIGRASCRERV